MGVILSLPGLPPPCRGPGPMLEPVSYWSLPQWCHSSARPCPAAPEDLQGAARRCYSRHTPLKTMLPEQCQVAVLFKSDFLSCNPLNTQSHQSFSSFFISAFGKRSCILCGFYNALSLNKCKIYSSPECLKNKIRLFCILACTEMSRFSQGRALLSLWRPQSSRLWLAGSALGWALQYKLAVQHLKHSSFTSPLEVYPDKWKSQLNHIVLCVLWNTISGCWTSFSYQHVISLSK